jgi:hypothetical protein
MAMFVHLTLESWIARIRRESVNCSRHAKGEVLSGVFALEISNSFDFKKAKH